MKNALIITLLYLFPHMASANDYCSTILSYGVFDRDNTLKSSEKVDHLRRSICTDFEGKFGMESVGMGIEHASNLCTDESRYHEEISSLRNAVERASSVLSEAWLECMKLEGTKAYLVPSFDPKIATLNVNHVGGVIDLKPIKTHPPGTCDTVTAPELSGVTDLTVMCRRPSETATATITVDTVHGFPIIINWPPVTQMHDLIVSDQNPVNLSFQSDSIVLIENACDAGVSAPLQIVDAAKQREGQHATLGTMADGQIATFKGEIIAALHTNDGSTSCFKYRLEKF